MNAFVEDVSYAWRRIRRGQWLGPKPLPAAKNSSALNSTARSRDRLNALPCGSHEIHVPREDPEHSRSEEASAVGRHDLHHPNVNA